MKLNPIRAVIEGKRLVVVDDSIVRGNTTGQLVDMLYKAGAREVHLRISSPPIRFPCFYGIDMATRDELIAARLSVAEIGRQVGATSLTTSRSKGCRNRPGCRARSSAAPASTATTPSPCPRSSPCARCASRRPARFACPDVGSRRGAYLVLVLGFVLTPLVYFVWALYRRRLEFRQDSDPGSPAAP